MKPFSLFALLTIVVHLNTYAADVSRKEPCSTESMLAKTRTGALMLCKNKKWDYAAFGSVNIHLTPGQIAQDPSGCLYVVAVDKAGYAFLPVKDEAGMQLCADK